MATLLAIALSVACEKPTPITVEAVSGKWSVRPSERLFLIEHGVPTLVIGPKLGEALKSAHPQIEIRADGTFEAVDFPGPTGGGPERYALVNGSGTWQVCMHSRSCLWIHFADGPSSQLNHWTLNSGKQILELNLGEDLGVTYERIEGVK